MVDELKWCDYWPEVPDEYDDDRFEALCRDCGVDTLGTPEGDWYMVRDEVWAAAGMPSTSEFDVFLHRRCLEERLGRRLTAADYTDAPVKPAVP